MWLEFISVLMFGFIISKFSNLFRVLLFSWVVPGLHFSYITYSGYVICLFFSTNCFKSTYLYFKVVFKFKNFEQLSKSQSSEYYRNGNVRKLYILLRVQSSWSAELRFIKIPCCCIGTYKIIQVFHIKFLFTIDSEFLLLLLLLFIY